MDISEQVSLSLLREVAYGQSQRTVLNSTQKQYLGQVRVIVNIIYSHPELREMALLKNESGNFYFYKGLAHKIYKLKLPMNNEVAKLTWASISIDKTLPKSYKKRKHDESVEMLVDENEVIDARNPAKNVATVSKQVYQNYKSALKWFHEFRCDEWEKEACPWPSDVDTAVCTAISAYKRDVAEKKSIGVMPQKEGKSPYSYRGYIEICHFFNAMKPIRNSFTYLGGIFAGLFTKLSVNSMGRSDSIDEIIAQHFDWLNDALTVNFSYTKPDQCGETTSEVKRLFSNWKHQGQCVILSLAVFVFCTRRCKPVTRLFEGKDQNKRYYNLLMEATKYIPEHIDLGCSRTDIGTHSNRKFAESSAASKVDGPNRIQVCLRAGQGIGRTQQCYMNTEEDGDSICGRTNAQLALTAEEFDILPCHFSPDTEKILNEYKWKNICEDYEYYPPTWVRIFPKLFASLVYAYHSKHMEVEYEPGHPIYSQLIFRGDRSLINEMKDKVHLKHGICDECGISASGVPGFIVIQRELREFRDHYNMTCGLYEHRLDVLGNALHQRFDGIAEDVASMILARCQINGAVPVTTTDIRNIFDGLINNPDSAFTEMRETLAAISTSQSQLAASLTNGSTYTNSFNSAPEPVLMQWPGDLRPHGVPKGFKFPSLDVKTMWGLWFFGKEPIRPYRFIDSKYDLPRQACKVNLSRCRKIMSRLVEIAIAADPALITNADHINSENSSRVFDYAYPILLDELYQHEGCPCRLDTNINTLGNKKMKKT